ncbi:PepSY domain-containing protein [Arthrobacter sp. Helios]|uniref:PepSY domain-containing protein n=1 Tax=Arthrobacter sp. Helios TaxID=2828862 RepID=UPI002053DD32|nr:PepSY domain-containing protein [Arthrobacter sp. Helios]UPO78065.1 PepSY domain-containing protein [Arthrobacter sp. Helios]
MRRVTQAAVIAAVIALTGCTNTGQQQQDEQSPQPAETSSSSSSPDASSSAAPAPGSSAISLDEAGRVVTDQYGGEVIGVEDDDYRGTPAWEVEVKNSNEGRIEVKVDKTSGEILDVERD